MIFEFDTAERAPDKLLIVGPVNTLRWDRIGAMTLEVSLQLERMETEGLEGETCQQMVARLASNFTRFLVHKRAIVVDGLFAIPYFV